LRHDKIDIPKSKQEGRIIRKTWIIESIIDFLVYSALIIPFPLLSGFFFFDKLKKGDYLVGASVLFGLALIYGGLLLYSILNLDRLKRINGTLTDRNRQIIKDLADKLGWDLLIYNKHLSVIWAPWSSLSTTFGRQIIVIYGKEHILTNSTCYLFHDIKSPYHWFGNRNTKRIIKESFEKEIKETLTNNNV